MVAQMFSPETLSRSRNLPVPSLPYEQVRPLIKWVYAWMGIALFVTTLSALFTASTPALVQLAANPIVGIGAFIVQIGLVIALSALLPRISPGLAAVLFLVYAATLGFSLSLIFLVFSLGSLVTAFATTTILFGIMSIVGFTTNTDLTKFGNLLFMALIGLIVASFVNILLGSGVLQLIISIVGVLIFMGLTAYDTQNLKRMAADPAIAGDRDMMAKMSIFGALGLYLNFINIFIFLLQIMGGGSND